MKVSPTFFAILLFSATALGLAQSVVVSKRMVSYNRPRPVAEHKRSFSVSYPKVKASNLKLAKKIESELSYLKNFGLNIKEEITETQWLEEADFDVTYNRGGLLVVKLFYSGSGAYPDGSSKFVAINSKTGERITATQAFAQIPELVELIREKQKQFEAKQLAELKNEPEESGSDISDLLKEKQFSPSDLNEFDIDNSGITFVYDYGFPHAIQALEPESEYKFAWQEFRRFVNLKGPLAPFVRK